MEYSAKKGLPLNSNGIIYPFVVTPQISQIGIIFHSYFFYQWGRKYKGLSISPFLAINAKGGEDIKPKAKGPHHHNFKKKFEMKFQLRVFTLISMSWQFLNCI
jgi:hypothetical protein